MLILTLFLEWVSGIGYFCTGRGPEALFLTVDTGVGPGAPQGDVREKSQNPLCKIHTKSCQECIIGEGVEATDTGPE